MRLLGFGLLISLAGFLLPSALSPFFQKSTVGQPQPRINASAIQTSVTPPTPHPTSSPFWLEVSLNQRRVTLYKGNLQLKTYAIAIGREGWETPTGTFTVRQKIQHPIWINPLTNQAIPAGDPENPIGNYWIGFWNDGRNWIGFHGTPDNDSVGKAASHGCLRMYNQDIEELYPLIRYGTTVRVKS